MVIRFQYPSWFENLWAAHPVGVKRLAFKAAEKLDLTEEDKEYLVSYLKKRHKEDKKWIEGTYVPHLSTFLNQARWEDGYDKVKLSDHQKTYQEFEKVHKGPPTDEERERALAMLRETGLIH